MTKKLLITSFASLAVAACVPSLAAAASPVQLTGFTVAPSCVKPGGSVVATPTVKNTTLLPQTFYAQGSESVFGITVSREAVSGPYTLPPLFTTSQSQTTSVPWYTPWGLYTVNAGIGPSTSSPTSWSTDSTTLLVSPFC